MAKKTKRKVSQGKPSVYAPEAVNTPEPEAPVVSRSSFSRRTTTTAASEFNPDYSYVLKDLKRIGILAGSFFTLLIILSFIIK